MQDISTSNDLKAISKGTVKAHNPNIVFYGKKIKNKDLISIISYLRDNPKFNDTLILDFVLDLDGLIEKEKMNISDLLNYIK